MVRYLTSQFNFGNFDKTFLNGTHDRSSLLICGKAHVHSSPLSFGDRLVGTVPVASFDLEEFLGISPNLL